jgi:hypothetical protein
MMIDYHDFVCRLVMVMDYPNGANGVCITFSVRRSDFHSKFANIVNGK